MNYFRIISLATIFGITKCLYDSYNTKSQQQLKNNILKASKPSNQNPYSIKNPNFPTLKSDKVIKINEHNKRSFLHKWWTNIFKVNAQERKSKTPTEAAIENQLDYLSRLVCKNILDKRLVTPTIDAHNLYQLCDEVKSDLNRAIRILNEKMKENKNQDEFHPAFKAIKSLKANVEDLQLKLEEMINDIQFAHENNCGYDQVRKHYSRFIGLLDPLDEQLFETFCLVDKVLLNSESVEESDNCSVLEDEEIVGSLPIGLNVPKARFRDKEKPYAAHIKYNDYEICYCRKSRLPIWTVEHTTRDNVEDTEHRHWELIKVEPRIHPELDANAHSCETNEFDYVRVGCGELHPHPDDNDNTQSTCEICQNTSFWPLFYRYVKFLTEMYATVHVLSGALYPQTPGTKQNYEGIEPDQQPTHFIKCIYVKYDKKTCRLECYLIENGCTNEKNPELKQYLISRDLLEDLTGYKIFPSKRTIKDETPNNLFVDM